MRAAARIETTARLRAETLEALEARLALGIDLAPVERLALVGIANDLVGGVEFGKTRGRFRIVLVGVRMQFFGKPAIGALDVAFARTLGNPQNVIGVAHLIQTPVNSPARGPNACVSPYQCGVPQAQMQRARAASV